jgi:single-strand selective monofunctional uracil DNA glycosylase
LFAQRFPEAVDFFAEHLVVNYCPLAFVEESGANRTPDKLPAVEKLKLFSACDEHLREVVRILQPEWLLAIGGFAEVCARRVFPGEGPRIATILHPSPASPAANRDWAGLAIAKLAAIGVWKV